MPVSNARWRASATRARSPAWTSSSAPSSTPGARSASRPRRAASDRDQRTAPLAGSSRNVPARPASSASSSSARLKPSTGRRRLMGVTSVARAGAPLAAQCTPPFARYGRDVGGYTCTCRSARRAAATATSTRTPPSELRGGEPAGVYADDRGRRGRRWRARVLGDAGRRSTPCSSAAARRRCCPPPTSARILRRDRRRLRAGARRRGHDRGQPGVGRPGDLAALREAGVHPRVARHAERARRTCCRCSIARTRRAGAQAAVAEARAAGLRARQPRPDLRHAGRDRRRLARPRSTPRWRPGPTTSAPTR